LSEYEIAMNRRNFRAKADSRGGSRLLASKLKGESSTEKAGRIETGRDLMAIVAFEMKQNIKDEQDKIEEVDKLPT